MLQIRASTYFLVINVRELQRPTCGNRGRSPSECHLCIFRLLHNYDNRVRVLCDYWRKYNYLSSHQFVGRARIQISLNCKCISVRCIFIARNVRIPRCLFWHLPCDIRAKIPFYSCFFLQYVLKSAHVHPLFAWREKPKYTNARHRRCNFWRVFLPAFWSVTTPDIISRKYS